MYGNSDFDIRNRFTFTTTYDVPGKKSPGQMLEGWQINSIVTLKSGAPWSAKDATTTSRHRRYDARFDTVKPGISSATHRFHRAHRHSLLEWFVG